MLKTNIKNKFLNKQVLREGQNLTRIKNFLTITSELRKTAYAKAKLDDKKTIRKNCLQYLLS